MLLLRLRLRGGCAAMGAAAAAAAVGVPPLLLPTPAPLGGRAGVSWKVRGARPPAASTVGGRRGGGERERDQRGGGGPQPGRGRGGGGGGGGRGGRGDDRQRPMRQQQQQRQRSYDDAAAANDYDSRRVDDDDDGGGDYGDGDGDGYRYPTRPSRAAYRDRLEGEPLYGVAPILAALRAGSRTPHALLVQEGLSPAGRKDGRALAAIRRLAEEAGAPVRSVPKHELNMLSGNRPHQGLVLDASPLEWEHMDVLPSPEELLQASPQQQQQRQPVWLALDEVVDPQNLGAMLRSAYCLGASGVLACARNCAPLSPAVSKASAGAAELMRLCSCRSMPRTLADAADKGWAVVGAAAEADAVSVSSLRVDRPTLLVMGNEGYGLRATVRRCCTAMVRVDMAPGTGVGAGAATAAGAAAGAGAAGGGRRRLDGEDGGEEDAGSGMGHLGGGGGGGPPLVDSLNVSVATGIMLHALLLQAKAPSAGAAAAAGGSASEA